MPGYPRARGPVIQAWVDDLLTSGCQIAGNRPDGNCAMCGCRFGDHLALLPGDTTVSNIVDRTGWIECEVCDQGCGTWSLTPPQG
jgi:hypothetical protein